MKKFRTLDLAIKFYKECEKVKLKGAMKDQFERASLSIVLNLSEGSGRPSRKDKAKFYWIAYASLRETRTLLMLSEKHELNDVGSKLAAHIWKLAKNPGGT